MTVLNFPEKKNSQCHVKKYSKLNWKQKFGFFSFPLPRQKDDDSEEEEEEEEDSGDANVGKFPNHHAMAVQQQANSKKDSSDSE